MVDAVNNADDLRRSALELKPDVVVTDIEMPPNHDDDTVARRIPSLRPALLDELPLTDEASIYRLYRLPVTW